MLEHLPLEDGLMDLKSKAGENFEGPMHSLPTPARQQ